MPPPMGALLPSGVVMPYRHLLVVCAFRAGEVPGAAGRVGGDDGSLVVIVNVAALLALLAVGDHRTPLVYYYPARNLYCQRATSVRDTPARRTDSTASRMSSSEGGGAAFLFRSSLPFLLLSGVLSLRALLRRVGREGQHDR